MKFSIITPCKTLDIKKLVVLKNNLENQNIRNLEWIIGCSKDDFSLLSKLTSETIQIKFVAVDNSTAGKALNAAVKKASGDYFIFIDADDLLVPNCLTRLSNLVENQDFNLIDLSIYPTYEPATAFMSEIQKDEKYLPKWGGKALTEKSPSKQKASESTSEKEDNDDMGYFRYEGKNRFTNFDYQLLISGKAVKSSYFAKIKGQFYEDNPIYYADGVMVLLGQATNKFIELSRPGYIKIRHNDPINDPSLQQSEEDEKWQWQVKSWLTTMHLLTDDKWKIEYINYCTKFINLYLFDALATSAFSREQRTVVLDLIRQWLTYLRPNNLTNLSLFNRWSLRAIIKNRDDLATQRSRIVKLLRSVERFVQPGHRSVTSISRLAYQHLFTKLPVKQRVVFYESFLGRNISDSPKYIYQYLQKNYPGKFKHVWVINPEIMDSPSKKKDTIFVKRFGFRYMYYLAVSRYQVINMRQPKWFQKRDGTTFLATWHGTPLKHLVFDMDNVASANPLYKKVFYHQSRQWDYLISPNQYSSDIFEHAFMYPKEKMLPTGYPRNDILNATDKPEKARLIKEKLGIPQDKKVILYAPTWRDDEYFDVGKYKFTLKLDIAKLKAQLSDDYVLILRTHYFIANRLDTSEFGEFVFNESTYDDISELYLISDVLITDYSSVFFDYAILKRPILFYVYDYEKYAGILRGFYLDMKKDLPGPLLKDSEDVLNALKNLDIVKQKYASRYEAFSKRFNEWEDGSATKRVVDQVFAASLKNE